MPFFIPRFYRISFTSPPLQILHHLLYTVFVAAIPSRKPDCALVKLILTGHFSKWNVTTSAGGLVPGLAYPINDCFSIKIVNQHGVGWTGRVSNDKAAAGHKLRDVALVAATFLQLDATYSMIYNPCLSEQVTLNRQKAQVLLRHRVGHLLGRKQKNRGKERRPSRIRDRGRNKISRFIFPFFSFFSL